MQGSDMLTSELSLDPESTAVLVVDMQNDFLEEGAPIEAPMGREFVGDLARFVERCRNAGAPIVFTKAVYRENGCDANTLGDLFVPRGDERPLIEGSAGAELYGGLEPSEHDVVIEKHRFSAFYNTDLEVVLRGLGVDTLVMTGVTTENCVGTTARDAHFRDYHVVFLPDLTGTFDYPDAGFGPRSAEEIHETYCTIIAHSVGTLAAPADVLDAFDGPVKPTADGHQPERRPSP